MEGIMLTVDRLIDGLNGEDPGSARIYMAQIREEEVLSRTFIPSSCAICTMHTKNSRCCNLKKATNKQYTLSSLAPGRGGPLRASWQPAARRYLHTL